MAVVPIFVQLFFRAAVGVLGELALPQHSGQVIARETVGETGKVLLRIVTAGGGIQQAIRRVLSGGLLEGAFSGRLAEL